MSILDETESAEVCIVTATSTNDEEEEEEG